MATEVANPNHYAKIHLTERAAQKIRELLEKEGVSPEKGGLRVGVQGGGCSGLSYAMRLDTQARDRDKVFEEHGARTLRRPEKLSLSEWHDARIRRDADAPGFRFPESQRRPKLRLRQFVHGVGSTDFSLCSSIFDFRLISVVPAGEFNRRL